MLTFIVALFAILAHCARFTSANNALNINTNTQNGKHVDLAITTWGSDWYFAICSVMGFTAITITGASYMKPSTDRVFSYLSAALCFTAAIAYFAMGCNLGWTPIDVEVRRSITGVNGRNREIFYARNTPRRSTTSATMILLYQLAIVNLVLVIASRSYKLVCNLDFQIVPITLLLHTTIANM